MAFVILFIIPLTFILIIKLTAKDLPQYAGIREAIDRMNQLFRENVSGTRVVKELNKVAYESRVFQRTMEEAYEANIKAESTMMLLSPLVLLFTNILILIFLYMVGLRAEAGTVSVVALVGLIEYASMALSNIQQFDSIITIIPRSKVLVDKIEEILSTEEVLQLKEAVCDFKEDVVLDLQM